jgi:hypothetical protein
VILKDDAYMIDWNVLMNGADKLLSQGLMNMNWRAETFRQEKRRSMKDRCPISVSQKAMSLIISLLKQKENLKNLCNG